MPERYGPFLCARSARGVGRCVATGSDACAGTVFEKSRTPLTLWFYAMYLFTTSRHGVAAKELQRQLGVTYKTAWRMAHELRKHMANSDNHEPLSGHVEIDESYVGGKHKGGKRGRGAPGKTIVFGMLERQGSVRAGPVPNVRRKTLEPLIYGNVQRGSVISTDELKSYARLYEAPFRHGSVNHSRGEYVRGIHHVNSLEGYWSQLKRSIRRTHVHVSRKHLWKYVSEFKADLPRATTADPARASTRCRSRSIGRST